MPSALTHVGRREEDEKDEEGEEGEEDEEGKEGEEDKDEEEKEAVRASSSDDRTGHVDVSLAVLLLRHAHHVFLSSADGCRCNVVLR
jgi:hypothetical protein